MSRSLSTHRYVSGTLSAVVAAAFVAGVMTSPASAQEKVRWKVPIGFPSTLPALGDNAPWVADRLDKASGGNIKLKIEEPGKIVPAFQIMEAVKDKKVPAGYTWVGYDQGKIPATPLISAVPFGMEPWEFNSWWYYGGGKQLGEELYAPVNIHPILCGIIGPETAGWFKFEIKSLDDIKGLKIRFAGLGGKVLEKLGASVTMIPGGEIFQALEKGTIDASEFSLPEVDEVIARGGVEVMMNPTVVGDAVDEAEIVVLTELRQGQVFGEVALVDQGIRSATIRVSQANTLLLRIDRYRLMQLCDTYTDLGYKLMKNLAADLAFKIRNTDLTIRQYQLMLSQTKLDTS
jgi:hypothetical protein